MKLTEFRKLIREEVRKVVMEGTSIKYVKYHLDVLNARDKFKYKSVDLPGGWEPSYNYVLKKSPDGQYMLPRGVQDDSNCNKLLKIVNNIPYSKYEQQRAAILKLEYAIYDALVNKVSTITGERVKAVAIKPDGNGGGTIAFDIIPTRATHSKIKNLFINTLNGSKGIE